MTKIRPSPAQPHQSPFELLRPGWVRRSPWRRCPPRSSPPVQMRAGGGVWGLGWSHGLPRCRAGSPNRRRDGGLHIGPDRSLRCAVAPSTPKIDYPQLKADLLATFLAEPLTELVRRIDRAFGGTFYTLRDVF